MVNKQAYTWLLKIDSRVELTLLRKYLFMYSWIQYWNMTDQNTWLIGSRGGWLNPLFAWTSCYWAIFSNLWYVLVICIFILKFNVKIKFCRHPRSAKKEKKITDRVYLNCTKCILLTNNFTFLIHTFLDCIILNNGVFITCVCYKRNENKYILHNITCTLWPIQKFEY